ncbi:glutamate receptor ionotropic, kainate 3-like [Choristoneura fumiferana]|uniref:glutamate receptor ionotropic, kainate 3-like n=1 Tax=Choristoneura fumiferana TaxID=7141 RepID=UPI003D15BCA1
MIKVLILAVFSKCVLTEGQFVIGGLFYEEDSDLEVALNSSASLYNFTASVRTVSRRGEVLEAGEHVCALAQEGVIGIIDGTSGRTSAHVQAICDLLDIPHVLINHNDFVNEQWLHINLNPSPAAYNMVLKKLVTIKEWTNVTLLYEKGYSLLRASSLLEMATKEMTVSVRELSGQDYRDVLIDAKMNGYVNFVVDCPSDKLKQLLTHAQQVGLMADEQSYIFLSLDLFTMDLTPYRYGGVNMTGFRIVNIDEEQKLLQDFLHEMPRESNETEYYPQVMNTRIFLIHDAVYIFYQARSKIVNMEATAGQVNCEDYQSWEFGTSLLSFMKTTKIEGITRSLNFDDSGQRSDVTMEVVELTSAGPQVIGAWESNDLIISRPYVPPAEDSENIMRNKTFKVLISIKAAPYTYLKESTEALEGNDRYEGYAIDLFQKLGDMLGFNCEFENNEVYGSYKNGKLTGMVKEIAEERADFGICDFTINAERQKAIDFSIPFMTLGIGILYKEPSKQPPAMFSFMAVFAPEVWYYMVFIQVLLGIVMIVVGRLSNKEWQNPVPCIEDPEELSNQFSFANSVWLIIGSVMQQGSEIAPIALAPRMITSIWWFFTMIMVASYVGTLVAFLTVEKNVLPFTNVKELYEHPSLKYGCKNEGSTKTFFESQPPGTMYRDMHEKMISKNWNVDDNDKGIERAENENYALFMESTSIEYYKERHCELMQIGDLLDSKSYGIGMKMGTPYKKIIDDALLKLKENGELQKLKDLWWKEKRAGKCGQQEAEKEKPLDMKNMQGVFVVLSGGCVLGLIISILDMLWGVFKRSVKYKTTFKYELVEELKFAIKFNGDIKPVKRPAKSDDTSSAEALAEAEVEGEIKDEVRSLRSALSGRSTDSRRTCHSHSSRHSASSLSVALARRRKYS